MSLTDPLQPLPQVIDQLRQHVLEESWSFSPPLVREMKRLVDVYDETVAALADHRRYTTVGCPKCGASPDDYCVSAQGRPQDFTYGAPYFHADRRRAVDAIGLHTVGDDS